MSLLVIAASITYGFSRVFLGWEWFVPVLVCASIPIGVIPLLRNLGLWRITALFACGFAGAWVIVLILFPDLTKYGFATLNTVGLAASLAFESWVISQRVVAPLPATPGMLILAMSGVWIAASTSALISGRDRNPAALLPWLGVFGYLSAVGVKEGRFTSVVLFLGACLMYLHQQKGLGDPRAALRSGAAAVGVALLIAPVLPGYGDTPLVRLGEAAGGTRIAPFEALRENLQDDRETEMFSVQATKASYWRLTSLDRFNGQTWRAGRESESEILRRRVRFRPDSGLSWQTFQIEDLRGSWLPAGYRPAAINIPAIFQPRRETVVSTEEISRGLTYTVTSVIPALSREELEAAPATGEGISSLFLELPDDTPRRLLQIARDLTADAPSPFAKALAIQQHLREFEYNLDVEGDHSSEFLVKFLTETKEGYCEQFAGAMAVLLRALDIPARVAIGFLPGERDSGSWKVTNRDAHAWPEAYFDGIGWVAFEPTPRSEADPPAHATPALPAAAQSPQASRSPRPEPAPDEDPFAESSESGVEARESTSVLAARATGRIAVSAALLLLLSSLAARAALAVARVRWNSHAAAFLHFVSLTSAASGETPRPDETERDWIVRVSALLNLDRQLIVSFLDAYHATAYSTRGDKGEQLGPLIREIRRQVWAGASLLGKVRMVFSPRPAADLIRREICRLVPAFS